MKDKALFLIVSAIIAASPISAAAPDAGQGVPAPADSPGARYCMRVAPVTGRLVETIECWTRAEWADQGVDVDREWAREGVSVLR